MHFFVLFVAVLYCFSSANLCSQDTIVHLPPSRFTDSLPDWPVAGVIEMEIDSLYSIKNTGPGIGNALSKLTGAYFRQYAPGLLGSFSFRGTGPERSLILWNDVPLINNGVGQQDYTLIMPSFGSKIFFRSGAAGAQFGSGAAGGTLKILNIPHFKPQNSLFFHTSAGSFGNYSAESHLLIAKPLFQFNLGYQGTTSLNYFPFQNYAEPGAPESIQTNAGFTIHNINSDLNLKWKKTVFSFNQWTTIANRNVPSAIGVTPNNASQNDLNLRFNLNAITPLSNNLELKSQLAFIRDQIHYQNNEIFSTAIQEQYLANLYLKWSINPYIALKSGIQWQYFRAIQNTYTPNTQKQHRPAAFLLINYTPNPTHHFMAQLRQQWAENLNPFSVGTLGYTFRALSSANTMLAFRTQLATHYRIPTFNDLFWVPGGNPNLRPEKGWQTETGFDFRKAWKNATFEGHAQVFYQKIDDWIRWMPTQNGIWSPENLLTARGMPYTPHIQSFLSVSLSFFKIEIKGEARFISERYTQIDNAHALPHVWLADFGIGWTRTWPKWQLKPYLQIDNLADTQYQTIRNYPLPGRFFRAGIQIYISSFNP
jgi:vitamin B12 transporter